MATWHANISDEHRFVLWAPPRTGARFTFQVLQQFGLSHYSSNGEERPVPTHAITVPQHCREYQPLLLVRNPYSRLLSLWRWQMQLRREGRQTLRHPQGFKEFYNSVAPGYMAIWPMLDKLGSDRMRLVGRSTRLHLETLREDIDRLPFVAEQQYLWPENRYASKYDRPHKISYYTPGLLRRVAKDYAQDFMLGGYDPDAEFD